MTLATLSSALQIALPRSPGLAKRGPRPRVSVTETEERSGGDDADALIRRRDAGGLPPAPWTGLAMIPNGGRKLSTCVEQPSHCTRAPAMVREEARGELLNCEADGRLGRSISRMQREARLICAGATLS
ncbi:hypothetical protein G7Z17_g12814 [Cylindrodendrum hubeiense]|uniref:Uncharacterized protein n=1 Tax=Cylindrodendrum hubeiense TaxID=595255 RepID=A0A9P5GY95_9HYPO|nr:hypothetical protein G7Z17_g12814 [Cylindrodendrum hubeiense]